MTEPAAPAERSLHVAFIDHVARPSGAELAMASLVASLPSSVRVTAILGEDGPLVARLIEAGAEVLVRELPQGLRDARRDSLTDRSGLRRHGTQFARYVADLRRELVRQQVDLVHTNSLKAHIYGGLAARSAGRPLVWHVRDRISVDYLSHRLVQLVRAAAIALPNAVIANSRATLATVPKVRRATHVYNPVIPPDPLPARAPGRPFTVGVVGRLASWKGQHVFLEAFARAFQGTEVRGHVIGAALFGEETYEAELIRLRASLGLEGQVEFRGFRPDIWTELADLDVLVHASVIPEPFGQVVLEGLASGLPVVASNAGGPAEVLQDGHDGVLVAPGDPAALAVTLQRLHDSPQLRERLGANARTTAAGFTPEATARRVVDVYRSVLPAKQF